MTNVNGSIKAIIFDCDGTLVDSEEAHLAAWRRILRNRNHDLTQEQCILCTGKPDTAIAELLTEALGFDCSDELLIEKRAYFRGLVEEGLPPIAATVDFVRRAAGEKQRLGLKLGVASAAVKDEILGNLRELEIEDLFDIILSGHDDLGEYSDPEGVNKPKPYIYLHAAKILNLSPQECVVIEDSVIGITAGKQAGCITVAVPNQITQHHDLSGAALKIETFSNISVDQFLQMLTL